MHSGTMLRPSSTSKTGLEPRTRARVLLVDPQTIVRQGLHRILETDHAIELVGETGDGRTAVEMTERLRPDVVVIDVTLPALHGIVATARIVEPDNRVRSPVVTSVSGALAV